MCAGEADGALGSGVVRVSGRRVPGSVGQHPRSIESYRQRHRHDQDDSSDQGLAASTHAHPQEQAREGNGYNILPLNTEDNSFFTSQKLPYK